MERERDRARETGFRFGVSQGGGGGGTGFHGRLITNGRVSRSSAADSQELELHRRRSIASHPASQAARQPNGLTGRARPSTNATVLVPACLPAWLPACLPALPSLPCLPGGLPDCLTAPLPPARSLLLPSIRSFSLYLHTPGRLSPHLAHLARSPASLTLYSAALTTLSPPLARSLTPVLRRPRAFPPLSKPRLCLSSGSRLRDSSSHSLARSVRASLSRVTREFPSATSLSLSRARSLTPPSCPSSVFPPAGHPSTNVFLARSIPPSARCIFLPASLACPTRSSSVGCPVYRVHAVR